ncbi:inhibitor of cysteine peptidase [Methanolinea mesophila]|uniref:protease inhibitor I42 family protein n=1 Tax=Methanolinea mesophila TaxID=547055 RepID=UPI001FD7C1B8|nr:protease inhibitor I42 family protein [Methanolinea mesophila]MBP1929995.1 inhibitor of cysteine peptidase [Methanolinea mesophila]
MKKFVAVTGILVICLAAMLVAGCTQAPTQPATPTATPTETSTPVATTAVPETTAPTVETPMVYNESADGSTITVPVDGKFVVVLAENPTTGYSWNVTVTSGLEITNDTYIAPETGLVGAGGSHQWDVKAIASGQQEFSGVYMQPWMNATGNETTFTLMVTVP